MPRFDPYSLQLQISRLFEQGQAFFATAKVEEWLRAHQQDPNDYNISFRQMPAPPGSSSVMTVVIDLQRKDGQPVDEWLQQEINQQ
ncbi:hypothetical protein IFO70_20675 [Phormidium tenue FACHB-886]|nr:hypothetical protein [Phormidium tenue FACHB-886]